MSHQDDQLFKAATDGCTKDALLLLARGANINATDEEGRTPLMVSILLGHNDFALSMVNAGAGVDVNSADFDNWTPLHCSVRSGCSQLTLALLKAGADVNAKNGIGWGALSWAVYLGSVETTKLLICAKSDVNSLNIYGGSVLELAAAKGGDEITNLLRESGAKLRGEKTSNGRTELHFAGEMGYTEFAKTLLIAGEDINCKDNESLTALNMSLERGYEDTSLLLVAHGAVFTERKSKYSAPLTEIGQMTMRQAAVRGGHIDRLKELLEEHPLQAPEDEPEALAMTASQCSQTGSLAVLQSFMAAKAIDEVMRPRLVSPSI